MNEVMENILTRRSVRAFLEKEIPMEELEQIVKAGAYAPSAMNRQTWKFTVLTDREKSANWQLLWQKNWEEPIIICISRRF